MISLGLIVYFFRRRINDSSGSKCLTQLLSVEMGILILCLRCMVNWVCCKVWPKLKYVSDRMMSCVE